MLMGRVREEILPYLKTGANNISPIQKVSLINFKLLRIGMNIFHTVYQKLLQSVKNQNVHFWIGQITDVIIKLITRVLRFNFKIKIYSS